jgi:hypothetical protein
MFVEENTLAPARSAGVETTRFQESFMQLLVE